MIWEKILKRAGGIGLSDIRVIKYVMRDGNFRTADAIMDEIYELIQENKKLGVRQVLRIKGRPMIHRQIGSGKKQIKAHMTNSPEFESRDTGNKIFTRSPILEYRYIGV